jgi:hypothetical protein
VAVAIRLTNSGQGAAKKYSVDRDFRASSGARAWSGSGQ